MITGMVCKVIGRLTTESGWLQSVVLLVVRLFIARVFFRSGRTKIASWETTIFLFTDEYKVPLLPPEVAAYMATAAELSLPVLLVLGFMTQFAALGLFIMALVIELFVYPGTTEHYYWMLLLGIPIVYGSGKLGVDFWLFKKCSDSSVQSKTGGKTFFEGLLWGSSHRH